VETTIDHNNSDGFLLCILGHYRQITRAAAWSKLPVEVFNAVNLVGSINSECESVQVAPTDNTVEAGGMIWLASCSQHAIHDWFRTDGALLQCRHVAVFTMRLIVNSIEGLATQQLFAVKTGEAADMEQLI